MPQIFRPGHNTVVRVTLVGGTAAVALILLAWAWWFDSPGSTGVGREVAQPIPFSHRHHVSGLGIDCRYCHTSVEVSSFAGIPPTDTCMNCHWQIWTDAAMLEPVRASWRTGRRLRWQRVHNLPDFVFFDHSVHVTNGVGCVTCHGRIDQMPLSAKAVPLTMQFCLFCHRDPYPHLRPPEAIFDLDWVPPPGSEGMGHELAELYGIDTAGLTDCTTCHR